MRRLRRGAGGGEMIQVEDEGGVVGTLGPGIFVDVDGEMEA